MNIKMLAIAPLSVSLIACGGDNDSSSINKRMLSLTELEEALPVTAQGTDTSLTGLWLMQFTSRLSVDSTTEDDEAAQLHYLHGRQAALITETEDGFKTSFCGSYAFRGDIDFAKVDNTSGTSYVAGLVNDSTHFHLNISGNRELEGELMIPTDDGAFGEYQFLAVKLSDATTFAGASNGIDINASLALDGKQYEFSELGDILTCVGGSSGSATDDESGERSAASHSGFTTNGGAVTAISFALSEVECLLDVNIGGDDLPASACDGIDTAEIKESPFDGREAILDTQFRVEPEDNSEQIFEFSARIGLPEA